MINTPKLKKKERSGIFGWYPYYAGYSPRFVSEILSRYASESDLVLDPWLGGGTTTSVATSLGLKAIGQDVNPALTTVARSKLAAGIPPQIIGDMFDEWFAQAAEIGGRCEPNPKEDALGNWYAPSAVRAIRRYSQAIAALDQAQADVRVCTPLYAIAYIGDFFRLVLFRTIRSQLKNFETSNPTWLKRAKSDDERIRCTSRQLENRIVREKNAIMHAGYDVAGHSASWQPKACIVNGTSTDIRLPDNSVDLVVTSPPYCTRIDYVRATLPELSLLSTTGNVFIESVSSRTIGLTTTEKDAPEIGKTSPYRSTLNAIRSHASKASDSYYYRYFAGYFDQLDRSVAEISRVLKEQASAILVLQDSHYKDIHIDLTGIVRELGEAAGMKSEVLHANYVTRSYSNIHPYRGRYRSSSEATESVILLSR